MVLRPFQLVIDMLLLYITVHEKENIMKESTNDQLIGKAHELKGTVKQVVGQVTNNPDLESDGKVEEVAGTIQKKIGQVEKVLEK